MILKDKVVIVTGAGPGMGQAMCHGAAAEGAKVVVTARSQERIDEIVSTITANGGEAIAVSCDVSKMEDCQKTAKAALDKWGRIDGLVNSAYFHPDWKPLEHHSIEELTMAFDVIATGALRMTQSVLPTMRAQGGGSIVNVSTLASRKPYPNEGGYAMAKSALNQMTRHMAVELTGSGIRINTTAMGWLMGAPLQSMLESMGEAGEAFRKQRESEVPVGHIPPEEDCAKAIYFFLSDYSSEITGAILDVNGGDWVAP